MKFAYVVLLSLLSATVASANPAGISSDLVVCRNKRGKIKRILGTADRWEAENILAQKLDPVTGKNYEEMLENLHLPFKKLDKDRYHGQMRFDLEGGREVQKVPTFDFDTPPSSKLVGLPEGCRAEPVIFERKPRFWDDPHYYLNLELWDPVDDATRAEVSFRASIAHEAFELGHVDDRYVRYFVRTWLKSAHPSHGSFPAFLRLLNEAHLVRIDIPTPEAFWSGDFPMRVGRCLNEGCTEYAAASEWPDDFTPQTRHNWELYLPKACEGLSGVPTTRSQEENWPHGCRIQFVNGLNLMAQTWLYRSQGIFLEFGRRPREGGGFIEDYVFTGAPGSFFIESLGRERGVESLDERPGRSRMEVRVWR